MPTVFKTNALLSAILAAALYFVFMFAKHDPMLSTVAPFLDDPYDAVGSFAVISSILLVIVALVRAFRPYRNPPTGEQEVFLIRTQMAIVLATLITLASDCVAMARHTSMWLGTPLTGELLALLGGILLGALVVAYLIRRSLSRIDLPRRGRWKSALVVSLLAILILAVYPESLINDVYGHLFTILVGILLLFAPMSALDIALASLDTAGTSVVRTSRQRIYPWIIVLLFALGIGLLLFFGETHEGGGSGVPLARLAVVFGVFVGAGAVGILIGYAFLRKPLGLLR